MPFVQRSAGEALRSWSQSFNDPQSLLCTHPADFTLFEIGEMNLKTGVITPHKALINLGTALQNRPQPAHTTEPSLFEEMQKPTHVRNSVAKILEKLKPKEVSSDVQ